MSKDEKQYLEKVLKKYEEKQVTKLDELRSLDKKATQGATVFAYVFGSIASLIMGFGMCVAMEVILPGFIWLGILVGLVGILLVSVNYPLYKKQLAKGRAKYALQIKALSEEILNN